jgi:hypothetical protein
MRFFVSVLSKSVSKMTRFGICSNISYWKTKLIVQLGPEQGSKPLEMRKYFLQTDLRNEDLKNETALRHRHWYG